MNNNKHVDSGYRCLMGHGDGVACIRCFKCNKYLRPKEFVEGECSVVEDFERSYIFNVLGPGLTFYLKDGKTFCMDTQKDHNEMGYSMIKIIIKYLQGVCDMEEKRVKAELGIDEK